MMNSFLEVSPFARHQWHTPTILASWEVELRRILVREQPRQKVHETLSQQWYMPWGLVVCSHPSYSGSINRRVNVWANISKKKKKTLSQN
jgi:hypothetical protein